MGAGDTMLFKQRELINNEPILGQACRLRAAAWTAWPQVITMADSSDFGRCAVRPGCVP
jgi:hypothetical protein